ncbi:MAG: 2-oxoacid:acceptor oxidoreductase family protein [Candidatus Brocadiia bacterium]
MLTEIRWHARGGQGTLLAARTLARVAIKEGKYAQGMPEFGAERMGAPVRAYNRISDQKLFMYFAISNPDVVIVLDPTLLSFVNVTEGLPKSGIVLVNTALSPEEIKKKLNLKDGKTATIDATGISIATLRRPMPNTPMLGALLKLLEIRADGLKDKAAVKNTIKMDSLLADVQETFAGKFSPKVVEANITSIKRGYQELKVQI